MYKCIFNSSDFSKISHSLGKLHLYLYYGSRINIINRKVITNPSFDHLFIQINLLLTIQGDLVV